MSLKASHLSDLVWRAADRCGDRVALQDALGVERVTYRDLRLRATGAARTLRERGLPPGERVMLVLHAGPDWMVALLALWEADLVAIPLPSGTPPELAGLVARYAGVAACVHDEANRSVVRSTAGLPCLMPADLAAGDIAHAEPGRVRTTSTAVLVFTSGSTARPRAVALSHANLVANLSSLMAVRQAADDETFLSVLPPAHLYELVAGQLAPLASGSRIVYSGAPLPNRIVETIRTERVTRAQLVPALLLAVAHEVIDGLAARGVIPMACRQLSAADLAAGCARLDAGTRTRLRLAVAERLGPAFRTIAVGGAALDPAWVELVNAVGIGVDVGYGLTEAGPLVSMGSSADLPPGSVGRPLPGVEVRISPAGEVLVRSGAVMQGYAGDAPSTAAALDGGWLHTGDRGRIDDDGALFITGRIKEAMVTAAGETLYPDEVEPYYDSPLFLEYCVVATPDTDGNDRPMLVVVGQADVSEADLHEAFAAKRAAAPPRYRLASMVRRTEPLPRTAVGKIRRRLLADVLVDSSVPS